MRAHAAFGAQRALSSVDDEILSGKRVDVFDELMKRCPDCRPEELEIRLAMAIEAMFSTLAALDRAPRIWQTHLAQNLKPIEKIVDMLLDFMCSGVMSNGLASLNSKS